MKKGGVIFELLIILILVSFVYAQDNETNETEEVVCATDINECSDGSYVSRNPDNNCEFDPCPEECPSIIGWRIEGNNCISDSGCDYDSLIYNYYNTEEECIEHLESEAQCGENIACVSERREYCNNSNACSSETVYDCIDGKCVVSETSTGGCTQCPYECKDGVCLTKEEPGPGPEPRPDVCAARISISFDKNVYYVGDEFKVEMGVFDSQGNPIPNYPFYIKVYDYEKGMWHTSFEDDRTGGDGYKIHQDKMSLGEPFRFGKNKLKIYTDVGGCNLVEDIAIIEIKRKEGPEPVPCGMGSCVPEEEEEEEIPGERGFYSCSGCEADEKCYPIGYRKSGVYCTPDNVFVSQIEKGECDNSFECASNVCISGDCLTENFIEKIIKWFKKLFGGEDEDGVEKKCSKLLIEKNIGEYIYSESLPPGGNEHLLVPIHSEDGEHLGTIKCCAAVYRDAEDTAHGVLFCAYDSKEDVTNSVKWLIAKERNFVFKEFRGQKVFGDNKGQAIVWINNAYLIAVGPGAEEGVSLPEDLADAYLKKYPSEFELTEDDIPDAPPSRPWVYCTEEDKEKGYKCESQPGARLQTDPHPEKDCEVYVGCILPYEKCEEMTDIKEKEDCYVRVAEMTGDSSVCKEITSDESRRNKCYVKAAETSKDASICEKITEDDIKRMCLELAEVVLWASCKSGEDMLKEECHFIDDFESGLENWFFHGDEGYGSTEVIDGNTVLKLTGVVGPELQREWDNYMFKFRFKRIEGSVHVYFRKTSLPGGQSRYIVAISEEVDNLNKHVNENWPRLDDTHFRLDDNWHTLEIRCYDNILNVYLDDELIYKYKDTENPLLYGMPGFEFHTGGRPITPEFLIDDVEVKLIGEGDVVYP